MVWQLLAKPLLGVVADGVKGFVETKKAKQELKLTSVKAATKLEQMKGSWKDEFVLLALMIPAICAFLPFMQPHIERGFEILSGLPEYYRHLLYLACSVSLGVRAGPAAINMFKKK
jgi:hypothetical protein